MVLSSRNRVVLKASGNSLLHSACIRRDSISFYAMSFYSAACYVFAYDWGRGQPVVLSDLPIGSEYLRTLFSTRTRCGARYPFNLP